jgi:NAD-dependent dihydropyrimidine dehydrogenase PreA subunit
MDNKIYMVPNPPTPNKGVIFNSSRCNGCNQCVEVCPNDVLMPNPAKRQPPLVLYPEECWFCGGCVEECSRSGAIEMPHPASQNISVNWKRKSNGEYYRVGMKNPPAPNNRPPSGK